MNQFPAIRVMLSRLAHPLFMKDGGSWTSKNSTACHFFRDDEQATQGVPLGDGRQTRRADRAWRQGAQREAGPQRPLPMRVGQALQEVLHEVGLLLMASIEITTFRE